jgi:hypothetical protein
MDKHDYFAPMFEESLHDCKNMSWCYTETTVCKYCNTDFDKFQKLLHHLAYHDYDIREFLSEDASKKSIKKVNSELGDHGMMIRPVQMKKKKGCSIKNLSEDMMRLIDIKKK